MITGQYRKPPIPVGAMASIQVESAPESIRKVRNMVAEAFREMGYSDGTIYLGMTIASELATNAHRHASVPASGIVVRVYRSEPGPVVEVADASETAPQVQGVDLGAESGRGLLLMEALVTCWGYEILDTGGKVVWAAVKTDA